MQKQSDSLDPRCIKALALDLDGTALMPDAALGRRTLDCLKKLIAQGVRVIICTGRAVESAERFRKAMGAEGPMVYFNGAEVIDMPSRAILSASLLDLDIVDFGIDLARSMGIHYQIFLPNGVEASTPWEALLYDKPTPEGDMYFKHTGITPIVRNLKEAIAMPSLRGCVKAMFIADPFRHDEVRQKMYDRFGNRIYIARTFPTFLEIMSAGVSKGAGLKTVMRHLNIEAKEVLALGDEENDILMFEAAGFSAAPANARENVKKAAGQIFGPNSEEGLAAFLEELFY